MNKSIFKLIRFMVIFFFASALFAIDVPLEYVKYPDKPETYFPAGMARLKYTLNPPPGDWKFPDFISAKPIYSLVKLGDEEKLLIMDRQKVENEYYNRWSLSARATTECPWITLDGSGDSVVLKFGEPYVVSAEVPENRLVSVHGSTTAKSSVFLLFTIRGQGNEDISDLSHIKGTQTKTPLSMKKGLTHRPKEPTYTIVTADGKTAAQGSFEYG